MKIEKCMMFNLNGDKIQKKQRKINKWYIMCHTIILIPMFCSRVNESESVGVEPISSFVYEV
jgi:hypothetical protein